jgi:hypothetical protein
MKEPNQNISHFHECLTDGFRMEDEAYFVNDDSKREFCDSLELV